MKLKGVQDYKPLIGMLPCGHAVWEWKDGVQDCVECREPEWLEDVPTPWPPPPRHYRLYQVVETFTYRGREEVHVGRPWGPKRSVDRHVRWLRRNYRDGLLRGNLQALVFPVAQ